MKRLAGGGGSCKAHVSELSSIRDVLLSERSWWERKQGAVLPMEANGHIPARAATGPSRLRMESWSSSLTWPWAPQWPCVFRVVSTAWALSKSGNGFREAQTCPGAAQPVRELWAPSRSFPGFPQDLNLTLLELCTPPRSPTNTANTT